MSIEVIQYDMDHPCLPIHGKLADPPDLTGEVLLPSSLGCLCGAITCFGLDRHEYVGRAVPDVLVIPPGDLSPDDRFGVFAQFLALLIEAKHWLLGIVGFGVQIKDILHSLNEFGSEGWNHPHFFPARA